MASYLSDDVLSHHQYLRPHSSSSITPSNKKSRMEPSFDSTTDLDRLSDLPENVLDQILSNLLIKDAVKTSLLSKTWRHKYETMSSLVFDDRNILQSCAFISTIESRTFISIVDRVLLLHSGPIHKFEISVCFNLPSKEIEKWISVVSRRNLKVLVFKRNYVQVLFQVPFSMFSCQTLTDLELHSCSLEPPKTFKGFKNLKSLKLESVYVFVDVLETLISNSPVLEMLYLGDIRSIDHIRVKSTNLKRLIIGGIWVHLRLENTPSLIELSINVDDLNEDEKALCLERFLLTLPQIQSLHIGRYYVYGNRLGEVHRDNPASLIKLKYLSIEVNVLDIKETSYLLSLLKWAPNLQELRIKCMDDGELSSDSMEPGKMSGSFTRLRCLELENISGYKHELDFISFMLLSSPALEIMTIDLHYPRTKWENTKKDEATVKIMTQVSFGRASPKAKIIIYE